MTHTPGPWKLSKGRLSPSMGGWDVLIAESDASGDWIAQVLLHKQDEGRANARLIAAAPEMYDALTTAMYTLLSGDSLSKDDDFYAVPADKVHGALDLIRAVLAKAEGK